VEPAKKIIVLGSGRSGTSMVAGCLRGTGLFEGQKFCKPTKSNPKGFFEDREVNLLNESILKQVPGLRGMRRGRRWLAIVPNGHKFSISEPVNRKINKLTGREAFCYKDPRFCYTLPCWLPKLPSVHLVCVFRHPDTTVRSMLRECKQATYLRGFRINRPKAIRIWECMYLHVLKHQLSGGNWLFLHYDQMLFSDGTERLEEFLGLGLDSEFPDTSLRRTSASKSSVNKNALSLYARLCSLSGYSD